MVATTTTTCFLSSFGGFKYNPPFGEFKAGGEHSSIEFVVSQDLAFNILLFIPTVFIGRATRF